MLLRHSFTIVVAAAEIELNNGIALFRIGEDISQQFAACLALLAP